MSMAKGGRSRAASSARWRSGWPTLQAAPPPGGAGPARAEPRRASSGSSSASACSSGSSPTAATARQPDRGAARRRRVGGRRGAARTEEKRLMGRRMESVIAHHRASAAIVVGVLITGSRTIFKRLMAMSTSRARQLRLTATAPRRTPRNTRRRSSRSKTALARARADRHRQGRRPGAADRGPARPARRQLCSSRPRSAPDGNLAANPALHRLGDRRDRRGVARRHPRQRPQHPAQDQARLPDRRDVGPVAQARLGRRIQGADQAADPENAAAARRARLGQGPARQRRADRHRQRLPPRPRDREPARRDKGKVQ